MLLWLACTGHPADADSDTDLADTGDTDDTDTGAQPVICADAKPRTVTFGATTAILGERARARCVGDGDDVVCGVSSVDPLWFDLVQIDPDPFQLGVARVDPSGGIRATLLHDEALLDAESVEPVLCAGQAGLLTPVDGEVRAIVEGWTSQSVTGTGPIALGPVICGLDGALSTSLTGSDEYTVVGTVTSALPGPVAAASLASNRPSGIALDAGTLSVAAAWPERRAVLYFHDIGGQRHPRLVGFDLSDTPLFSADEAGSGTGVHWTGAVAIDDRLFLAGNAESDGTIEGEGTKTGDAVLVAFDADLAVTAVEVVPRLRDLRIAAAGPDVAVAGTFYGGSQWLGRNATGAADAFVVRLDTGLTVLAAASHGVAGQSATLVSDLGTATCEATVGVSVGGTLSFVGVAGSALDVGKIEGGVHLAPPSGEGPWVVTFDEGLISTGADTWPSSPDDLAFGTLTLE